MPEESSQDHVLYDVSGLAEAYNISERMVRILVHERRVPVVRVGRLVRIRKQDMDAYIASRTTPAVTR